MFHLGEVASTDSGIPNLYLVIGFKVLYSCSVPIFFVLSNIAPSRALVAGGYFCDNLIILTALVSERLDTIAESRFTDASIVVSGIFLT